MNNNRITLIDALSIMDKYNQLGCDCHFEGNGDGTVSAICEYFLIINKNEKR